MSSIRKGLRAVVFGGRVAVIALLALGAMRLVAQEPMDDPGWQQRCSTLDASMVAIDKGAAPVELLATTAGIAGEKFAAIARERSAAGQHWVSCSMFFTAAMAERQGNGGKVNTTRAHSDVVLGFAEMKLAQGKSLGFAAKMMRAEESVMAFKDPAITPADLAAVLGAFGPMGVPGGPGMVVAGGMPPGAPGNVLPGVPTAAVGAPVGGVPAYVPPGGATPAVPAPGAATAAVPAPAAAHVHHATTHTAHKPGTAPAAPAATAATPHA